MSQRTATARELYAKALREGDPLKIAEAAQRAGVDEAQVAADVAAIERVTELRTVAEALPKCQKATAERRRVLEAAAKALDAALAELQPRVDAAAIDLQEAERQEREARGTVAELAALLRGRPDLFDPSAAPAAVRELWTNADAESARSTAYQRWLDAGRAVERAGSALAAAEREAARFAPFNSSNMAEVAAGADALVKHARERLAAAELERTEAAKAAGIDPERRV